MKLYKEANRKKYFYSNRRIKNVKMILNLLLVSDWLAAFYFSQVIACHNQED